MFRRLFDTVDALISLEITHEKEELTQPPFREEVTDKHTAEEWYDKGFWFKTGGYYYRDCGGSGVYCADGTYPGCERGCNKISYEDLMGRGFRPITEEDMVCLKGFRPSEWVVTLDDGSVNFKDLWQHLLNTVPAGQLNNPMTSAKICKEYFHGN